MKGSPIRAAVLGGLILVAASSASADDEPISPVPAAAEPKSGAAPILESIRKAREDGKTQVAAKAARTLLDSRMPLSLDESLELTFIECECLEHDDRFEDAILAADRGLRLLDPQRTNAATWALLLSQGKSLALFCSGRVPEAEGVLDELVRRFPATESEAKVLQARAILKASRGPYVDPRYEGALAGDPRIPAVLKRLEAALPLAFEKVRRRMGDPNLAIPSVLVVLSDQLEPNIYMDTQVAEFGTRRLGFIRVCAQCAVSELGLEASTLAHELTHVLQFSRAESFPLEVWEREGIAHWMEQEPEREMWEGAFFKAGGKSLLSAILEFPAIADPDRPWSDRAYKEQTILGELLFRHLERTRGTESVRAYARAVFRSTGDPRECFRAALGAERRGIQTELHRCLLRWMRSELDGLDELTGIRKIDESGDFEAKVRARTEFLSGHHGSVLRPLIRLGLFQLYMDNGRCEEAAGLLGAIREEQASRRWPITACEFKLARARGDLPEVVCKGTELLLLSHLLSAAAPSEIQAAVDDAKKRLAAAAPPAAPAPPATEPGPR